VRTAAVALDLGWADPLALLSLDPRRYQIAAAIVAEAQELRNRRVKAELDYLANASSSRTVAPLARHITGLVKALSRRA